jgi:hypothetical protein
MRLPSGLGCATLFDLHHETVLPGVGRRSGVDGIVIKGPGGALLPP